MWTFCLKRSVCAIIELTLNLSGLCIDYHGRYALIEFKLCGNLVDERTTHLLQLQSLFVKHKLRLSSLLMVIPSVRSLLHNNFQKLIQIIYMRFPPPFLSPKVSSKVST
jgi:hypothetical protein